MHIPVLLKEVLDIFDPKPGENCVDATIGDGGHGFAILERIYPDGKVLGIDWDERQIEKLKGLVPEKYKKNLILVKDNYQNLENIIRQYNFSEIRGIVFDLGFGSYHIEESGRGFSFQKDEPLMMSNFGDNPLSAKILLNSWNEEEIERVIREYGDERYSRKIAHEIVVSRSRRPISFTRDLLDIIMKVLPKAGWKKIHPATRTFQALRIAVNGEYENIRHGLEAATSSDSAGGADAATSLPSGEDRIVKNFFREKRRNGLLNLINKKPITPKQEEIADNPRSRSAKLRTAIKI